MRLLTCLILSLSLIGLPVFAEDAPVASEVEILKKKIIELNRDLFILEEDLLFPAHTQIAVFVSLDTGEFLKLDTVKLKINDDIVASHLYTDRQLRALARGGMQRLYVGNIKSGPNSATVFVEGIGPSNTPYKKAAQLEFVKDTDVKKLEIRIADQSNDFQPEVSVVEW